MASCILGFGYYISFPRCRLYRGLTQNGRVPFIFNALNKHVNVIFSTLGGLAHIEWYWRFPPRSNMTMGRVQDESDNHRSNPWNGSEVYKAAFALNHWYLRDPDGNKLTYGNPYSFLGMCYKQQIVLCTCGDRYTYSYSYGLKYNLYNLQILY